MTMWQDPIVVEIHQIRDKISQVYGDDLHAIFVAAQRGELAKQFVANTDVEGGVSGTPRDSNTSYENQQPWVR